MACALCGTSLNSQAWIDEQGHCLTCSWEIGAPEADLEVLHNGLAVELGLHRLAQTTVPSAVGFTGKKATPDDQDAWAASMFAYRKLTQLHPEAYGLYVELWYASRGKRAPRKLKTLLGNSLNTALEPIRQFLADRESREARKVR